MGKRTGVHVIRTTDDVKVMMFLARGTEECTTCHRTLAENEAYTKGVGPQGHNHAPYCSLCMPFSTELHTTGVEHMLHISTSEQVPQKPLIYVKLTSPGLTAIQDLVNKSFAEHNVTASMQIAYFNDDYYQENDHNQASHVVSMIIDPNLGV